MVFRARALVVLLAFASSCSALLGDQLAVIHCAAEDAFGAPTCPLGETCVAGACNAVGVPPGAQCAHDSECRAPASCTDTSSFDPGGGKRCLLPCRSSEDCLAPSEGLVCRPLDLAAASVCWPASELPPRAPPGKGPSGAACLTSGECRSGLCHEARCTDVCARDEDCVGLGTVCRVALTPLASTLTWTCSPAAADSSSGGPCAGDDDCRSGACTVMLGSERLCAAACCSSRECSALDGSVAPTPGAQLACSKVNGIRACSRVVSAAALGAVGSACGADEQCRSGLCAGEGGERYCSDLCCDDASCGDSGRFACRLVSLAGSWALRCVRR